MLVTTIERERRLTIFGLPAPRCWQKATFCSAAPLSNAKPLTETIPPRHLRPRRQFGIAVARITVVAVKLTAWLRHKKRRLVVRVYIEIVAAIIGLLGVFVALTAMV